MSDQIYRQRVLPIWASLKIFVVWSGVKGLLIGVHPKSQMPDPKDQFY